MWKEEVGNDVEVVEDVAGGGKRLGYAPVPVVPNEEEEEAMV